MNKQQYLEKCNSDILDLFVENPKGEFQYEGKWYSSKYGCDLIDMINDLFQSKLSECWDMAGEVGEKLRLRLQKQVRNYGRRNLAHGLCITCPKPLVNKKYCEYHAEKNRQRALKSYWKNKNFLTSKQEEEK